MEVWSLLIDGCMVLFWKRKYVYGRLSCDNKRDNLIKRFVMCVFLCVV